MNFRIEEQLEMHKKLSITDAVENFYFKFQVEAKNIYLFTKTENRGRISPILGRIIKIEDNAT
jgi:hypothetical protein